MEIPMTEPKVVLAEYGMDVPDGMDVKMIPAGWMWLPLRQLWFPQSSQLLGTTVSPPSQRRKDQ